MENDLEKILRPIDTPMPKISSEMYNAKGRSKRMVVRQVGRETMPHSCRTLNHSYISQKIFMISSRSRVYAELLGYYTYRVQDEYVLVAQIDGELVGLVNGRILIPKSACHIIHYHCAGGLRIGAHISLQR